MIKKEFKLSLIKLAKFVVIFLIADLVLGTISKQIFFNQKTGKYARSTYAIKDTDSKILIFGSSHAHRHYVPKVFEKELGKTCYNVGAEGQQLLYHTAMLKMILKRTKPDLIILNIDENFLYKSKVAYDRLSDLHPYYSDYDEELGPILGLKSKLIDFKMFFKSYQTNSTVIHAIKYYLSPQIDYNGYRPLSGQVKSVVDESEEILIKEYVEEIDENFVMGLKNFISTAKNKGISLLFVTSPTFSEVDHSNNISYNKIKEIAGKENIPFVNFFNATQFKYKHELFHDTSHLNNDGAQLFCKYLADEIKNRNLVESKKSEY
ncbi:hypothetical protein [uncultured Aquimarina sp.]|uniref:hypothetical protein n=1 Tax=uncultured Aquimarina sp. TaxID=575652 RepID=UPI002606E53A|nr:hypothetical protein [uncultured Aquimarina sp.]